MGDARAMHVKRGDLIHPIEICALVMSAINVVLYVLRAPILLFVFELVSSPLGRLSEPALNVITYLSFISISL